MTESSLLGTRPRCTFLWVVKDFKDWYIGDDEVFKKSSAFPANEITDRNWFFTLSLEAFDKSLDICVHLETSDTDVNIDTSIKCSVIDAEFHRINQRRIFHIFRYELKQCRFSEFINQETILEEDNKILCNGNLVIFCEVILLGKSQNKRNSNFYQSPTCNLGKSLSLLLHNGYFFDFEVQVNDIKFLCHKFLLACRSEYFSGLFRPGIKENNENKLILTDMDPDIFQKIHRYFYTGEIEVTEGDAFLLLLAAEKFGLARLKSLCEEKLYSSLSVDNATEMFTTASIYNLQRLKINAFLISTNLGINDIELKVLPAKEKCPNSAKNWTVIEKPTEVDDDEVAIPKKKAKIEVPYPRSAETSNEIMSRKASPPKAEFWCCTERQVSKKYLWTIRNFKKYEFSDFYTGASWRVAICDEATWDVKISIDNLNTQRDNNELRYINIRLKLINTKQENGALRTEYKFSVLNKENKAINILKNACTCTLNEYWEFRFITVSRALSRNTLSDECDLRICCRLAIAKSSLFDCTNPTIPKCDLADDIATLLRDKRLSDTVVKIQEEPFPCHKAVLACYSPYFASKFQDRGSSEEVIEIDDIDQNDFKKILTAMYTGKCELTVSEVLDLLPLENKYSLFETTPVFDEAFVSALSVENVCKILIDIHGKVKLRNYVLEFIGRNFDQIIEAFNWCDVAKREDLLTECLNAYSEFSRGTPKVLS